MIMRAMRMFVFVIESVISIVIYLSASTNEVYNKIIPNTPKTKIPFKLLGVINAAPNSTTAIFEKKLDSVLTRFFVKTNGMGRILYYF